MGAASAWMKFDHQIIDIVSTFRTAPIVRSNGVHAFAQRTVQR